MKSMWKVFVAAAMVLLASGAYAQQPGDRQPMHKAPSAEQIAQRQTERMTRNLQLTDAQSKQLYEVNLEAVRERAAKMEQHRAQMQTIREAQQARLKTILTPEQYTQYEASMRSSCPCANGKTGTKGDCSGKKGGDKHARGHRR